MFTTHNTGRVILGPPGVGKTTFVNNQPTNKRDWVDQDDLFGELGLKWQNTDDPERTYTLADKMLEKCKQEGYRIIGSLFWTYKADAIVIPELEQHRQFIQTRPDLNLDNVIKIRDILSKQVEEYNIPVFLNCQDAVDYVENLITHKLIRF